MIAAPQVQHVAGVRTSWWRMLGTVQAPGLPDRGGCRGKGVRRQSAAGGCRIGVILAAMAALHTPTASAQPVASDALRTPGAPASIGTATMLADGTVVLHLRAAGPGAIGDALLRYPPSHPDYRAIRNHLPGLEPGRPVPVPPFE